jgi:hypothetical protein
MKHSSKYSKYSPRGKGYMAGQDPTPQTTLLILLGASSWPLAGFSGSIAFEKAVRNLQSYFLDPNGFRLPERNILNLFNSNDDGPQILKQISGCHPKVV